MSWIDWTIPLPGLVFLFTVLEPLPPRWREALSGIVTWTWLAVLLLAYVISGPKFGLFAGVFGSFILGCLMQPLGAGLADRAYPRIERQPAGD